MKLAPETNLNLSKAELKSLVLGKKRAIQKLVSQVKHCKNITLSIAITGEYMTSTQRRRLTPSRQANIENWHYSHSVKVDKDMAKKKNFLSLVTKQLIDGLLDAIERVTWYCGLTALAA